jgi:predicted metal-dependent phosphotriesterase family hydrolase
LGFGNQGAAQAQNLRDSGIPNDKIVIANRDDAYAIDAISKGFTVEFDLGKAAEAADGKRANCNLSYTLPILIMIIQCFSFLFPIKYKLVSLESSLSD